MARVLFAREKHGERILPADTDYDLAVSSVKLILERYDQGWYDDPDEYWEYRNEPPYTQELIESMPEGSGARRMAEQENRQWDDLAEVRENAHKFWNCVKATAQAREDGELEELYEQSTPIFTGRLGRKDPTKPWSMSNTLSPYERFPTAWAVLVWRKDHEYEYVELRKVEEAE